MLLDALHVADKCENSIIALADAAEVLAASLTDVAWPMRVAALFTISLSSDWSSSESTFCTRFLLNARLWYLL